MTNPETETVEKDLSEMSLSELRQAAIEEAPDDPEPEPIHDDVPDCPRCGSSETGWTDNPHFPENDKGCSDCLFLWS